ncbi:MAG: ABC transporter permease subunit, partial [Bdellovibrionota bacterium]
KYIKSKRSIRDVLISGGDPLLLSDAKIEYMLKRLRAIKHIEFLRIGSRIPFALPQIFSGLKIASGLSVIGAIVGEFIGGGGLGAIVDAARTQQRVDKVFAAVLISAILGLVMMAVINTIGWLTLRNWHASARTSR